jgi:ornithine carbamoyltransferase
MRHLLDLPDLSADEIRYLLNDAAHMKAELAAGRRAPVLAGRVLGMIFEKPSLRTRVSFETGMAQMGGTTVFLPSQETGMGTRESLPDFARTMSQYVDAVVLRVFKHQTVETFARYGSCPVINGLSDAAHPCQALGDLLTLQEYFPELTGRTLAFVGDGNNVARSLAVACGLLGVRFVLAAPKGYGFDDTFLQSFHQRFNGALSQNGDPGKAVAMADVVYTDVWTSMGQEAEREERRKRFAPYQVNAELLKRAPAHARVMHCLPANREEEVTSEVLDSERSIVFQQAANRMHAQKALLKWLLTENRP